MKLIKLKSTLIKAIALSGGLCFACASVQADTAVTNIPKGAVGDILAETKAALEKVSTDPDARTHLVISAMKDAHANDSTSSIISKLSALAVSETTKEPRVAERLVLLGDIAAPNYAASDVHVVVAARRLLKLPDKETSPGQEIQRVNELVKDTTLQHPRVFHALIRLVRSEARRARYYRPLNRFALEVPILNETYSFQTALQAVKEAKDAESDTVVGKAVGICLMQIDRIPSKADWRQRFSRLLLISALFIDPEHLTTRQKDILEEANAAWSPRWEAPPSFPGLEPPRIMTRYSPEESLQILRREINLLTNPPAYVQNSSRRKILLTHQAANVQEMFTHFLEELPFIATRSETYEFYSPDREPLVRVYYGSLGEGFCDVVQKEIDRLPAAMRQKLRPQLLVAKYGEALRDQREEFLHMGILQGLPESQFYLVERYAYLLAWPPYDPDTSALNALLAVFPPNAQERLKSAFLEGRERWPQEPPYVNSANMWKADSE